MGALIEATFFIFGSTTLLIFYSEIRRVNFYLPVIIFIYLKVREGLSTMAEALSTVPQDMELRGSRK